jgi:hypothetical protein
MSGSEAADDAGNPAPARFIRMPASETFDGQERVMTRAAYDLQVRATVHSARYSQPGLVTDEYLAGLGTDTTTTAVELCAIGLDWEAVDVSLAIVRENDEISAWEREQETYVQGQAQGRLARPMLVAPPCAVCRTAASRIELVAPGQFPAEWDQWRSTVQDSILRQRQPWQWWLLFKGTATGNGYGDPIDASRAGRIAQAFQLPLGFAQVHTAGFYDDAGFCEDCDAPYCYHCWHMSEGGVGYCPRGHGKSLDPHWLPVSARLPDRLGVN